jgi:5-methylcytosine-specific restriction protein A
VRLAEFTKATKRDAFVRAEGRCEGKLPNDQRCNVKLRSGEAEYDHIIAEWLTRDNSLENCQVLCRRCHKHKTGNEDVPMIAKTKRQMDREQGIRPKKKKMGYRKFDGTIVPARYE